MTIKNLWQYLEKLVTHYWSQFFIAKLAFIIAQPFILSPFVEKSSSDRLKIVNRVPAEPWGHLPFQIQVAGVALEPNTCLIKRHPRFSDLNTAGPRAEIF